MSREIERIVEHMEGVEGISREVLTEAIRTNLLAFSPKIFGGYRDFRVEIGPKDRGIHAFSTFSVAERVTDEFREISLLKGREIKSDIQIGEVIEVELATQNFDRIVSQTLRQTVHQILERIRREKSLQIFHDRGAAPIADLSVKKLSEPKD